jgi:cyanophycinase-like exopeptidase
MKKILLLLLLPFYGFSQGYTSYFTGNPTNITTTPQFGVCLMGGATENDNAMIWLLNKANGGDVVVLRSSGSSGYNNYLYSDLGVTVNSVETLVITSVAGATNPYVLDKVANAEMIWIAGGDQWNYISFFKDNAMETLLNNHVNVKNAPIGGTSAGMAILGGRYFSAQNGSVTSAQAMVNPYATNVTLGGYSGTTVPTTDFLNVPFLGNVITDTHYDNPDRRGRHATFIGRYRADYGTTVNGIACNEYVAVCIGSNGIAHVYGDYPNYQEFAYFIQPNCNPANGNPYCVPNQPFSWSFGGEAYKVYKVPGTMSGSNTFDLNSWQFPIASGGSWENWSITNGIFAAVSGTPPNCVLSNLENSNDAINIYPNPVKLTLFLNQLANADVEIYDIHGRLIHDQVNTGNAIDVSFLTHGIYFIKIINEGKITTKKFIKE